MKQLIKKILFLFGLQVSRVPKVDNYQNIILVDKSFWKPFIKNNNILKKYYRSLKAVNGEWTNNFYKELRFYSLIQCIEKVLKKGIKGDFAECGTYYGHSAHFTASLIKEHNCRKTFHLFDSFEGLSARKKEDSTNRPLTNKDIKAEAKMFAVDEKIVRENLKLYSFIKYHKGWIPDKFEEVREKEFCFVHIDVDLYLPTFHSLDFFGQRLTSGGIIVVDDYDVSNFQGASKAVDDFLKIKKDFSIYKIPMGGAILEKT